jgi:sugar (pentulose or hexulose) kinase
MSFIGIDLGTSFIKGAVLDLEARQLRHIRRLPFPSQLPNPNPLLCEFDPTEILTTVRSSLRDLSMDAPDCAGIVMCTQMHGMVLLNERGEVRSNCLTWRDQRSLMPHPSGAGSYLDVLNQRIGAKQRKELGNEQPAGEPNCFLFWLAEQGKLEPGLMPVSLPDFVLSSLCGSPPGVDLTSAAAYGLLNLETLDWHHEVIEALGLGRLRWPTLRQQGEVVGHLPLGRSPVPCYTPVGDYQCALLGTLIEPEELSLNISTGSQVSRLTPGSNLGDYQTRPFFDGLFLNTFTHIPAGRALSLLVDLLSELATAEGVTLNDPWAYIARETAQVADTDLEADLNFFGGPHGAGGSLSNLKVENLKVGHLFRAAFKSMAENYYEFALRIWPDQSWRNLVFSGGLACKFEVLRRIIQQRFQTDYRLGPSAEDTLIGLLVLALVFSGRANSVREAMSQLRSSHLSWDGEPTEGALR